MIARWLTIAILMLGCGQAAALDITRLTQATLDAVARGQLSLARACLAPVLISPSLSNDRRAFWYYYRGWTFYQQDYYLSAALDFARALQFDPSHSQSLYALGYLYLRGQGLNRDPKEAARLYLRAARQGYAKAQLNAGILYFKGDGVEQSMRRARYWLTQAADQGELAAMVELGRTYLDGEDADPAAALQWLQRAAKQGHAPAQLMLGGLYRRGILGPPDPGVALRWYKAAADQGDPDGQSGVAWVLATSSRDDVRDGKQALAYAQKAVAQRRSPEHLDTLAAAWAERGDFEQAVATELLAMEALSDDDHERAEDFSARLEGYRKQRAWRE